METLLDLITYLAIATVLAYLINVAFAPFIK